MQHSSQSAPARSKRHPGQRQRYLGFGCPDRPVECHLPKLTLRGAAAAAGSPSLRSEGTCPISRCLRLCSTLSPPPKGGRLHCSPPPQKNPPFPLSMPSGQLRGCPALMATRKEAERTKGENFRHPSGAADGETAHLGLFFFPPPGCLRCPGSHRMVQINRLASLKRFSKLLPVRSWVDVECAAVAVTMAP